MGREEKVITGGIYGAKAHCKVRAPGTIVQKHKIKLWKKVYVLGMNTETDR